MHNRYMWTTLHLPQCSLKELFVATARLILDTVTGATGGMGLQVVKAILQSGADVIAVDRDEVPKTPYWSKLHQLCWDVNDTD